MSNMTPSPSPPPPLRTLKRRLSFKSSSLLSAFRRSAAASEPVPTAPAPIATPSPTPQPPLELSVPLLPSTPPLTPTRLTTDPSSAPSSSPAPSVTSPPTTLLQPAQPILSSSIVPTKIRPKRKQQQQHRRKSYLPGDSDSSMSSPSCPFSSDDDDSDFGEEGMDLDDDEGGHKSLSYSFPIPPWRPETPPVSPARQDFARKGAGVGVGGGPGLSLPATPPRSPKEVGEEMVVDPVAQRNSMDALLLALGV